MPKRTFEKRWAYQTEGGAVLSYRGGVEYDVPKEVADYADKHGLTKRIKAAGENKMLKGPAENK